MDGWVSPDSLAKVGMQHRKSTSRTNDSKTRGIAFVRTSSAEQLESLVAQESRIRAWGVANGVEIVDVVVEQRSGKVASAKRDEVVNRACAEGLAMIVTHIDRLARKIGTVADVCDRLAACHTRLVVVDNAIDTSTEGGRLAVSMFALMAEIEGQRITARTAQVIDPKWEDGFYADRSRINVVDAYAAWASGESMRSIAARYEISQPSVSRAIKRHEARLARRLG